MPDSDQAEPRRASQLGGINAMKRITRAKRFSRCTWRSTTSSGRRRSVTVEEELGRRGGPYILGADFTLADIPLGLVVNRWFCVQGFDKPAFPAVAAYYETLSQRPAYRLHGRNGMP